MAIPRSLIILLPLFLLLAFATADFQSDELLPVYDDDEFEGISATSTPPPPPAAPKQAAPSRRRVESDAESNSVQFTLEHSLGPDGGFSPAGTFSARLKSSPLGPQTLTKLRFTRNALSETEKEEFKRLLKEDGFYTVRLPSNVANPRGKFVTSSIRARCLAHESLDEHIVIHTDGVYILAINYGTTIGGCPYPRPLIIPKKWSFNSHTALKAADQAPRAPTFTEQLIEAEAGLGEIVKPPEKSFWAKYWMYLIPLGLVVMNVLSAAANAPQEEQGGGQAQQGGAQRAPSGPVRRR